MQQYYTNKTDEKSYDVMICSIYDKGNYILPRQKVCTEYCVPFNHVHAKRFMNTFNLNNDKIVWPITKVYKLCDANKNIASALQKNFYSLLLNNNSEFKLNSNGIKYYSEMIKLILKK